MRHTTICVWATVFAAASASLTRAQENGAAGATVDEAVRGPLVIDPADSSGAKRFLGEPGELVTLYGPRRFDPYYEPSRLPPPVDAQTGWPLDGFGPYVPLVGVRYSPYMYTPYGYGYYRSVYRPWYVPYGYGYGWGYRYPFGFYPWYARRYDFYRPGYTYGANIGYPPYVDYGPTVLDENILPPVQSDYGGCFYW